MLPAFSSINLVGVRGFEPPAPASRRQCSTRLSYTPTKPASLMQSGAPGKGFGCWYVYEFGVDRKSRLLTCSRVKNL